MKNTGNKKFETTIYYTSRTDLPLYYPYPKFLNGMDLTPTTKVVYAMLLDRASLSEKNNWRDSDGKLFINYTIEQLAQDSGKSQTVIKDALLELENANLLERRRMGVGKPNCLYVKLPPEHIRKTGDQTAAKPASEQPQNRLPNSRKTGDQTAEKPAGNNLKNNSSKNNLSESLPPPATMTYGCDHNITLTQDEYNTLKKKYPDDIDSYIDDMSRYLTREGKPCKNCFTALQRWAERDFKKPQYFDPEKYYQEGSDSL